MNIRRAVCLLSLLCCLTPFSGCGKGEVSEVELRAKLEQISAIAEDQALIDYILEQTERRPVTPAGSEEKLREHLKNYEDCLKQTADNNCRNVLCPNHLTFAADELFKLSRYNEAYRKYAEAFELVRKEILDARQKRQEVNSDREEMTVAEYQYEYLKPTFMLYRNNAEATRLMKRMALALEKMTPEDRPALGFLKTPARELLGRSYRQMAAEHQAVAEQALVQSADEYRRYFAVRQELLASLEESEFAEIKDVLQGVVERDSLLELRRF